MIFKSNKFQCQICYNLVLGLLCKVMPPHASPCTTSALADIVAYTKALAGIGGLSYLDEGVSVAVGGNVGGIVDEIDVVFHCYLFLSNYIV